MYTSQKLISQQHLIKFFFYCSIYRHIALYATVQSLLAEDERAQSFFLTRSNVVIKKVLKITMNVLLFIHLSLNYLRI